MEKKEKNRTIPYGERWDYAALKFEAIAADNENLPGNMAVVEAEGYEQAVNRLVKVARKNPVSFAVWNQDVSEELQDYARRFMRDAGNGDVLSHVPPGKADAINAYITGYFNALARNIDERDRLLHDAFRYNVTNLIDAIQKKFPARSLSVSFTRGTSTDRNEFHLDGPGDEWKDTDDPDHRDLHYRPAIRFIINYDGPATCAAANEDIEFGRHQPLPNSPVRHFTAELKDTFNTVWEMQPWAVGIITNQRWPHPGAMHSGGISHEPGKCEKRLRLLVTVK